MTMLKELPNTVVNTKTRAEFDEMMKIYKDAGWNRCQFCSEIMFGLCIRANESGAWNHISYYKQYGIKIITLKEFKEIQGMNTFDFKVGDILINDKGRRRKALAVCGFMVALSLSDNCEIYYGWYTKEELDEYGYKLYTEPEIIEIDGKKYNKADVAERLAELDEAAR